MFWRRLYCLAGMLLMIAARGAGQTPVSAMDDSIPQESSIGMTQFGATGIFALESPEVVGPGIIAGGFSTNQNVLPGPRAGSYPLALSFGLANGTEAYAAFSTFQLREREEEASVFGMKINVKKFETDDVLLSPDFQFYHGQGVTDEQDAATAACGRLLAGISGPSNSRGYLALGYRFMLQPTAGSTGGIVGAAGATYPVNDHLLLGGEILHGGGMDPIDAWEETVGIKWYVFQHIQCAAALQGQQFGGIFTGGLLIGVNFSSGLLGPGNENSGRRQRLLPEPPPLEDLTPSRDSSSTSGGSVREVTMRQSFNKQASAPMVQNWILHSAKRNFLNSMP